MNEGARGHKQHSAACSARAGRAEEPVARDVTVERRDASRAGPRGRGAARRTGRVQRDGNQDHGAASPSPIRTRTTYPEHLAHRTEIYAYLFCANEGIRRGGGHAGLRSAGRRGDTRVSTGRIPGKSCAYAFLKCAQPYADWVAASGRVEGAVRADAEEAEVSVSESIATGQQRDGPDTSIRAMTRRRADR